MNIDWSNAPEGATHSCDQGWYKFCGCLGDWYYWSPTDGGWFKTPYASPENFSWWGASVKRPVEWSGEGLPPVGQTCERRFVDVEGSSWLGCIVLAHGAKKIFIRDNAGDEFAHSIDEVEFRPFRTAEQIAADERLHQIRNALTAIKAGQQQFPNDLVRGNIIAATVEAMIDAGYRKQAAP